MVDGLAQERALDLQLVLVAVHVPAAPRTAPAKAPALEGILGFEGRSLRLQAHGRLTRGLQQASQRQATQGLQRTRQQFQQGVAVIDGWVALVEVPAADQQVAELHALMALLTPRHLMAGAGQVLLSEDRSAPLAYLPVEAGVVGDDHRGIGCKGLDGGIVDALSSHVGIGDAGHPPALLDRARGALLGLAVGDALGTTLEFSRRDTLPHHTGMTRGGPFNLSLSQWTNDTSVALAHAESLLHALSFDSAGFMNRFVAWHKTGCLLLHRHLLRRGHHHLAGAKSRLANHP